MSYLAKLLVVLFSLYALTGCSIHSYAPTITLEEYPFRHNEFDYHYAWKTGVTNKGFVVEGFLKNVRYAYISELLLTVKLLDKAGKVRAEASDFPMPQQSQTGDPCNFKVLFKTVQPADGDVLLFDIRYTGDDGQDSGFTWRSSFKADARTGTVIAPYTEKRGSRF